MKRVSTGRIIACAALAIAATLLITACASVSVLAPVDPPVPHAFDPGLVAKGAELALIGNCNVCHTADGGRPYAGGRPLATPFGTMYGTNITPDPETGIGRWSQAAFTRAMREGVDREGRHLYPAFPYEYFTRVTDEDLEALYAFLMTREPVQAHTPPHELPFPLNIRSFIAVWKRLFFEPGLFQPDPARSAELNRGAYLAQGLGHCSACHTPRNVMGAEIRREYLAGGEAEGWHAPALNADSPAPVPWTRAELYRYLRTGLTERHAIAAGPMVHVVRNLAQVDGEDVQALALYTAMRMGTPTAQRLARAEEALARASREIAAYPSIDRARERIKVETPALRNGAVVYAGACAQCHDRGRLATSGSGLHLALGTAMTVPTSANLIRITLEGIVPSEPEPARWMPPYAGALTDEQVIDLVSYIRVHFGRKPPWRDVEDELKKAKESLDR